jgi:hypothetical protein
MTTEKFTDLLYDKDYMYQTKGDIVIVTHSSYVDFYTESIPPGVIFKNNGYTSLHGLEKIPPGVEFRNFGEVYLDDTKEISTGVGFYNTLGGVHLKSLLGVEGLWSNQWKGNIDSIDPKMLLNLMIKRELFT